MFRPWIHDIMECIGQHWAGHLAPCKIPEICEVQICIDSVLLSSIWKLISTSLLVCLFGFMYFFQFLPLSSSFFHFLPQEIGRNTFFPVSSILPGRNLFLPEVSEPWKPGTLILQMTSRVSYNDNIREVYQEKKILIDKTSGRASQIGDKGVIIKDEAARLPRWAEYLRTCSIQMRLKNFMNFPSFPHLKN